MPEKLPQLLDRIGKEALGRLHSRGVQINAFLLGLHHHYLDTALQRIFAHRIPLGSAEGALRVAYWDQMSDFLRRSPVPKVVPLEWSGPLKDAVSVLVVGVTGDPAGGLLLNPASLIDDVRRILHSTMLRSRFDLICFPRVPLVDVPASTTGFLRSLATEYRTVILIGFYDAAGNAGDRVVLYPPASADVVQRKLFADPTSSARTSDLTIQQLLIAPTHVGNLCILIGDDVEHESVRDVICRQNREADGIDIVINVATDTDVESPTALSRLCTDADAYGLWIQRGARPVLCAPGVPDRLGVLIEPGAEPLPVVELRTFTIQLAPLRRMRRTRTAQDASPGRPGARVPPRAWEVTPTTAASIEALRQEVARLGQSQTVAAPPSSPISDASSVLSELRTYLEENSRALLALGASVTALTDSGRVTRATAESVATTLRAVAEQLAQLQARPDTDGSLSRDEFKALTDLTGSLRAELSESRALLARESNGQRLAKLDESVRKLPDTIAAMINKQPVAADPSTKSESSSPTNETPLLLERVDRIDRTLEQLATMLANADSQDSAAVRAYMKSLDSR